MDPWSDKLEMLKAKPVGTVAEREKMPFEVTPFMLYLTRQVNSSSSANSSGNNVPMADNSNTSSDNNPGTTQAKPKK
jgi:hypothetical protein